MTRKELRSAWAVEERAPFGFRFGLSRKEAKADAMPQLWLCDVNPIARQPL